MDIFFLADVAGVARRGEIRQVADAYARNFLIPKKLGQPATSELKRRYEQKVAQRQKAIHDQAQSLAAARQRLEGVTVRIGGEGNEQGTLFAAVKGPAIIAALEQQYGTTLKGVHCEPDHFKSAATHQAKLVWPGNHKTSLTIVIEIKKT